MMNHEKQKILDELSKMEIFYAKFFMYWYDGEYGGKHESNFLEDDDNEGDFDMWLDDPQRLRDEKINEVLDMDKKNTIGEILPKKFDSK